MAEGVGLAVAPTVVQVDLRARLHLHRLRRCLRAAAQQRILPLAVVILMTTASEKASSVTAMTV